MTAEVECNGSPRAPDVRELRLDPVRSFEPGRHAATAAAARPAAPRPICTSSDGLYLFVGAVICVCATTRLSEDTNATSIVVAPAMGVLWFRSEGPRRGLPRIVAINLNMMNLRFAYLLSLVTRS
jgi:hypothetical protein